MKFLFIACIWVCAAIKVPCQSVYHFEFSREAVGDTTSYSAFFIRYADGNGMVRIKSGKTDKNNLQLVEMKTEPVFVNDSSGKQDVSRLYYRANDPEEISGEGIPGFDEIRFCFALNPDTNLLEPAVIVILDHEKADTAVIYKKELLDNQSMEKELVLRFFEESDPVYISLFSNNTRGLTPVEKKIRINLLIVANTNDTDIGESCNNDMQRAEETFSNLAEFLGIRINVTKIFGNTYNKAAVENMLKKLSPAPDDIVIFYYSGHGFQKKGVDRPYPFIDLRANTRQDYKKESINIEDIFLAIDKKGARFNLVLSDCCNNDPTSQNTVAKPDPQTRGSNLNWSFDNCRALFLNKRKMSVLMTAAKQGQKASSNNSFGGFFSFYFKASLEDHLSALKKNISWYQVLENARKETIKKADRTYCSKPYIPENICQQTPIYKVQMEGLSAMPGGN
ncbi:MAG: hypothetical protein GC171_11385 [Terrimonas sp.]|nr:hypothetical protein [Terrimonas sp.]